MIHINEVAKQTEITVRTLRYYDQIGLLECSSKTQGGHRLYSDEDLQKLQQIQFYKSMGYRLQEIKEMLTDPDWNWTTGLVNQLTYIREEQARLKEMELSLRTLLSGITVEGGNEEQAVQKLIKLSMQDKSRPKHFKEKMFNDSELKLWAKLPNMNGEHPESMEWIALLGLIIKYRASEEPSSPCVQNVVRRMLEKQAEEFPQGDEFIDKLWELRKSPSASEQLGMYPIEPEVLEYLEQAYEIYSSTAYPGESRQGGRV